MQSQDYGRTSGQVIVFLILMAGIVKCWSISRRPTTSKKCALSLLLLLSGWTCATIIAGMAPDLPPSGGNPIRSILGLAFAIFMVTSFVFAIQGLAEVKGNPAVYTQGKNQAIWSLILLGAIMVPVIFGMSKVWRPSAAIPRALRVNQPADGTMRFENFNFRFQIPNRDWVSVDPKKFNANATAVLMHNNPYLLLMIVAEKVGVEAELRNDVLVEAVKATMQSLEGYRLIHEQSTKLKQLEGTAIEIEFEKANTAFFGYETMFYRNGYAYQLILRGKAADRDIIRREAVKLFQNFELIEPDLVAHEKGSSIPQSFESLLGYEVHLKGLGWKKWSDKGPKASGAEFAVLYKTSGALAVYPFYLGDANPDWDPIVSAALARLTISSTDENLVLLKKTEDSSMTNACFSFERAVSEGTFVYRLSVTRHKDCAYLIGAWHLKDKDVSPTFLDDAIEQVTLAPDWRFKSPSIATFSPHQLVNQGLFFNDLALAYHKEQVFDKSLAFFEIAHSYDKKNKTFIKNLLEACLQAKQFERGLNALTTATNCFSDPHELRAAQGFFQSETGHEGEALKSYESAFEGVYQNDEYFIRYLQLLMARADYDTGLARAEKYLQTKESLRVRLWQAALFREKKEFDKAISLLQEQQAKFPSNKEITYGLWESYHAAAREGEALKITEQLISSGASSGYTYYLKGRSEFALKHYRESKSSFETALNKSPLDPDIKRFLDHVSGILGEGDNSSIKTAIAPVPIPEALLKQSPDVSSAITKEYGAQYLKVIEAISFEKGKETQFTEYAQAKVNDANGVTKFSSLQFSFDPLSESIFLNSLVVKDADGKVASTAKVADCYVVDEGGQTATQTKTLNVPIPGLQPGYTIEWTLTRRELSKADSFRFFEQTFSKFFPVGLSIVYLHGDVDAVKFLTEPNIPVQKTKGGIYWQVNHPPVYRFEPLQRNFETYLPTIWLGDGSEAWPVIAKDYLKSIKGRLTLDSTTRALAEKQVSGMTNLTGKLACLARFVQTNISYKAIEFGRRARVPNPTERIIENRYGDCKDHSLVLHQLLEAVGIPSYLAVIHSYSTIQKDLPSLDQFNHMIVYVPALDGGSFFDCTAKSADVLEAAQEGLCGQEALILDPENPRFISVPRYPTNSAKLVIERELKIENQTDAILREKVAFYGYDAVYYRALLKQVEPANWKAILQRHLSQDGHPLEIQELDAENVNDPGKPLLVQTTSFVRNCFQTVNGSLLGKIPVSWELRYIGSEPVEKRQSPFEIRVQQMVQSSTTILVPKGYRMPSVSSWNQDTRSTYAQSLSMAKTGGTGVEWQYEFRQNAGIYAAAEYNAYHESISKALHVLQPNIVLEKR